MSFTGYVPEIFAAWLLSIVIFSVIIVCISKHDPKRRTESLKVVFIVMFIVGMITYCICHYVELRVAAAGLLNGDKVLAWVKNPNAHWFYLPYVIIMSVMDVGMMFCGRCNTSVFYNLPAADNPVLVILFCFVNLIAFYTTCTALLVKFGQNLFRRIKIMTTRALNVDLLFGVNSDSLALGRNLSGQDSHILVYADDMIGEDYESSIRALEGVAYSSKDALTASESFVRSLPIRPSKTKLRLYALSHDYDKNLQYARVMSDSLKKIGVPPEQTELTIVGTQEWKGMFLQSSDNQYGYGTVNSFDEFEMSARLLIHEYPLCNAINFDENGRALEDMNVLIVGFGRTGHEVLRKAIANGQFEGSSFHATIYDPNFGHRTGFFRSQYPNMFANYDVSFEPHDGRSSELFRFLSDNASKMKYIVVCLKDREISRDIAIHMVDRLQTMGCSTNVYTCDAKGIRCYSQYGKECKTYSIYDSDLLYSGEIDEYAMALNHRYTGGKSLQEDWRNCAYFDRMSSRASVDYLVPLLKRVSKNGELTPEQRENLARSEHLRWCAFHYVSGYDTMEMGEFVERVKSRQKEIVEQGSSKIKTTKDSVKMKHVCLVDWDELDEIARVENSLTLGKKNYKEADRGNVDVVSTLLKR